MRWLARCGLLAFLGVVIGLITQPSSGTDWTDVDLRNGPWTFDRGVEYGYFADTSATVHQGIVRRKYLTSTNGDQVRAFLAWHWPADTAGAGYDLTYDAVSGRNYWRGSSDMPFGSYLFVEIAGSPDTLITSVQYIPIIGKEAPLGFVADSAGLGAGVVTCTRLGAGAVADSTKLGPGAVTGSKMANRIAIPGSFYVTSADSFATIRLLMVTEQLDTPDLRYFAGDSIDVSGVFLSMNQGATVRDTLTVARTVGDPGVIRMDDASGSYLYMQNSGVGTDWVIDWANPTLYYLTIGTSASQGTLKMYDGSSNTFTLVASPMASDLVGYLMATVSDSSLVFATVSGSNVTFHSKRVWQGYATIAASADVVGVRCEGASSDDVPMVAWKDWNSASLGADELDAYWDLATNPDTLWIQPAFTHTQPREVWYRVVER